VKALVAQELCGLPGLVYTVDSGLFGTAVLEPESP